MNGIRADLRSLPLWCAGLLVALAVVVLMLRAAGLLVCLLVEVAGLAACRVVDGAERVEAAVSAAAGVRPLAASVVVFPDGGAR
ncbi:hypothetical protein BBK14_07905 [Parafrankia soli]|uniref:Uncharacterized protein n=1 Tax=Parafrankia soli TaxID=2599596 RepID=A0A1S1PJZ8_9ACTN|nr:hypothetical protein [Parafrankia soli]OHV21195.1 hypothetical protein BBK14_07905 [Parafrankia soli]